MRPRRPAYAAALQARRGEGDHPWGVQLIVGDDWRPQATVDWPRIALKPDDWRPGAIDWRACVGVPVRIVDRIAIPAEHAYSPWLIYAIGGELAELAADVQIVDDKGGCDDLSVVAMAFRLQHPRRCYPGWWSREREQRYAVNRGRWRAAMVRWMDAQENAAST